MIWLVDHHGRRHISASNLSQRLGLDGPDDELRELADNFDQLQNG